MRPQRFAIVALGAALGLAAGIGAYTFIYAKGYSYLTNNPAACANCHIMKAHYDGWVKSSHHGVAACNDCHTPEGLLPKYATKTSNGFWHSFAFTSGRFPEPLRIKANNHQVIEAACRRCHGDLVYAIDARHGAAARRFSCVSCHAAVGHPEDMGSLAQHWSY